MESKGAVSIYDVLTAFYVSEGSASKRHEDVVLLLRKIIIKNIETKIKRILSVLSVKALVEYEAS